jgi:hypothetical protein
VEVMGIIGILISLFALASSLFVPEIRRFFIKAAPKSKLDPKDIIRLDWNYQGQYDEGVFLKFDPERGLGYYLKNNLMAYHSPSLLIDMMSLANDEWIKVAPYLTIRMNQIIELDKSVNVYENLEDGKGGGDAADYFLAVLSPNQPNIFRAPKITNPTNLYEYLYGDLDELNLEEPESYFNLTPNEREIFIVEFFVVPGYYYEFQVGIHFSYAGRDYTQWIGQHLRASTPLIYASWSVKGIGEFGLYPDDYLYSGFVKIGDNKHEHNDVQKVRTEHIRQALEKIAKNNRTFKAQEIAFQQDQAKELKTKELLYTSKVEEKMQGDRG